MDYIKIILYVGKQTVENDVGNYKKNILFTYAHSIFWVGVFPKPCSGNPSTIIIIILARKINPKIKKTFIFGKSN